ncbi:biotin--[acetyl-CoA-carboxylase] ligase [Stieleria sp. ICT_E10.1]|uniref:biotin--[acetyl-CoA-carboxylase] ligase n=1 Tax=Stieleria sedimenti TaxID=2976331 RepID=UPI00217FC86D|nr:biotin--[acetyl-CoA-carboxylase] ligase [Stieleria sedimenti]MCS7467006.1 biotin--[acetyl-CoA-carboxylase] ligase [Stieleria sedimenti]
MHRGIKTQDAAVREAPARETPRREMLFSDADLDHLTKSTFVERVDFHREIDSTNRRAMELARNGSPAGPLLILAESQTAGRGRGTNHWWADSGALTLTLLLDTGLPQRRLPQASLTVGLAVCEAIEGIVESSEMQLKWPNDVYCRQRKLSGILIELPTANPQLLAIGIGINVNNSLSRAPDELRTTAIALCDVAGHPFPLTDVLIAVLNRLQHRLECIGCRDDELRTMWRERCLLTNRTVQVDLGTRDVSGRCRGINDEGALVIETPAGLEPCYAGTVTLF